MEYQQEFETGRRRGGGRGLGRGPMGMWGMGEPGGRRRGPGRGRKGDVRNAILALLAEEPRNGYQLIGAIAERSDGLWRPSAGSVYPALSLLEDEGLVAAVEIDGQKRYELTDEGEEAVAEQADEPAPWEKVSEPHKGMLDIRHEIGQLAMAVNQVAHAGTPDQIQRARGVLETCRKNLYKILAED